MMADGTERERDVWLYLAEVGALEAGPQDVSPGSGPPSPFLADVGRLGEENGTGQDGSWPGEKHDDDEKLDHVEPGDHVVDLDQLDKAVEAGERPAEGREAVEAEEKVAGTYERGQQDRKVEELENGDECQATGDVTEDRAVRDKENYDWKV